jgi:TRAP-type C4-dicarboxylate transport system permease small subunit
MTESPAWPARLAGWLETGLLCLLLLFLLGVGCAQVVLRNFFDASILWADPLLRAGVLWIGIAGAVAAARDARHIRVDLLKRWLVGWPRALVEATTALFASVVAAFLAWHGGRMVLDELSYGTPGDLVPAWLLQSVIPIGFALMALCHGWHAGSELLAARRR